MNDEYEALNRHWKMLIMTSTDKHIAAVNTYFREIDSGRFAAQLFTANFEFFFPKYGVGRGAAEFQELALGLGTVIRSSRHYIDKFRYVCVDDYVCVEGGSQGTYQSGESWDGAGFGGGRFCSVFHFDAAGLIESMHIYVDPDYVGEHTAGLDRWPRRRAQA
jgi:hypothetical protein